MSESTFSHVVLPFGDGDYPFCLGWHSATEWEKQNDRSLMGTFNNMVGTRSAELKDIRSILHAALIGGGMTPVDATNKVRLYVEQRPVSETQTTALAVLEAFLFGNDEYREKARANASA